MIKESDYTRRPWQLGLDQDEFGQKSINSILTHIYPMIALTKGNFKYKTEYEDGSESYEPSVDDYDYFVPDEDTDISETQMNNFAIITHTPDMYELIKDLADNSKKISMEDFQSKAKKIVSKIDKIANFEAVGKDEVVSSIYDEKYDDEE